MKDRRREVDHPEVQEGGGCPRVVLRVDKEDPVVVVVVRVEQFGGLAIDAARRGVKLEACGEVAPITVVAVLDSTPPGGGCGETPE